MYREPEGARALLNDGEGTVPTQVIQPIAVVLVDSNPLARLAVSSLLEQASDIRVVGEAIDAYGALEQTRRLRPQVVLLDLVSTEHPNLAMLPELARHAVALVVTSCADPATVRRALRAGANGYLIHGQFNAAGLRDAVEAATHGHTPMSPGAVNALIHIVRDHPEQASPPVELISGREAEVMNHVVRGSGNAEIARHLHLSEKTVRNHVNHIYAKLGARTRAQAIAIWLGTSRAPSTTHARPVIQVARA